MRRNFYEASIALLIHKYGYFGLAVFRRQRQADRIGGGKLGTDEAEVVIKILMNQDKAVRIGIRGFSEAILRKHIAVLRAVWPSRQPKCIFLVKADVNRFVFPKCQYTPGAEKLPLRSSGQGAVLFPPPS